MPAWDVKKYGNNLYTPVPVSPLVLYSAPSGKYHGGSFFHDYLNVWILWLCASFGVVLSESWPDLTLKS